MTSRAGCSGRSIMVACFLMAAELVAGSVSPSLAVPRNPCAARLDARLYFPASGEVVSQFGFQRHPVTGAVRWRGGIDFRVKPDVSLYAAGLGRISKIGGDHPGDRFIAVDHGNGLQVRYANLSDTAHAVGHCVRHEDVLGKAGRLNPSQDGQILHIEVRRNGVLVDPSHVLRPY